jgi:hypothetical protein
MKSAFFTLSLGLYGSTAWAAGTFPTDPGDLTITEFMTEPENDIPMYYGEWFEIYNASGRNLDLDGLEIEGTSGMDTGFTISGTLYIAAGDYLILGVNDDLDLNGNVDLDYVYTRSSGGTTIFDLERTGDTIRLIYDGLTVDTVTWSSATWDVTQQYSHQVNSNAYENEWANDLPQNWCQAPSETLQDEGWYGTPGDTNSLCNDSGDDADGDGFTEATGDCDDDDAYVNPDAIDGTEDPYGVPNDDADCDGVRDDGNDDDDGDGYSEVDGDCDDDNASINPMAVEIYDDRDNDCNGCIDDVDDDLDGWTECGETDSEGNYYYDCDDNDNLVNPSELEIPYDDIDQDCDGFDECDVDEDGHFADSDHCIGDSDCCLDDKGASGDDCDDRNPNINPDMSEGEPEAGGFADGLDNDCSGDADEPYQDLDGDGWTASEGDCWDDADDIRAALVFPGAEELCDDLLDNDCNGLYNDNCSNPAGYSTVQGGGICGLVGVERAGRSGTGGLVLGLMAILIGLRRRNVEAGERR